MGDDVIYTVLGVTVKNCPQDFVFSTYMVKIEHTPFSFLSGNQFKCTLLIVISCA